MKQATRRTLLVVIGFVGYYGGLVMINFSPNIAAIRLLGLLLWLIGTVCMFWGFYVWAQLKGRSTWHTLWGLLTWVGLIVMACLTSKSQYTDGREMRAERGSRMSTGRKIGIGVCSAFLLMWTFYFVSGHGDLLTLTNPLFLGALGGLLWLILHEPRTEISRDERQLCLAYYKKEWELKVFQEKEANLYNEAVTKYSLSAVTDKEAAKELLRATKRLVESANEILRRRNNIVSVPDIASAMYFAWQVAYSDYLTWAKALAAVIEAMVEGMIPHTERLRELLVRSEKSRRKAEGEEKNFIKHLKLSGDELSKVFIDASRAVADEGWQPSE